MNDEEAIVQTESLSDPLGGDPTPQEDAESPDGGATSDSLEEHLEYLAEPVDQSVEDPGIFADPVPPADSDPGASDAEASEERLEHLRGELSRLQTELRLREERFEKLGGECEEFCALYPDVPFSALPDRVWQDVRRGIPLAAAYALAERKRLCTQQLAEKSNRDNLRHAPGELKSSQSEEFSPAEVRAMTPAEVRANYTKIMRSMQKWH
ncbi:MAG: hypothetical protein IJX62_02045 [Clostridia bacterium]|nr:hypothetical protein [Clostridia bacterium]